jgi:DHA2 family multidrug resistance protein
MTAILEKAIAQLSGYRGVSAHAGAVPLPRPLARATPKVRERAQTSTQATRWWIVIAAMIGAVLEVLDVSITNVAIPQMMGNLGATLSEIGWVSTGYIISNVIVLPMTGWLSARFGRRAYFAVSIAVFTIASVFCGLSHSLGALVFWRIVQGLGGGGLLATGQVIMLDAFPKSMQGVATAIFGMGVMVGPSLGPVLGGYLTDNLSWPWIFFINIPFGIVAVILTVLFVPDGAGAKNSVFGPIDLPGMLLLAIGMGSLQTVLERGQEEDWFESKLIVWLAITAVLGLAGFLWRELKTRFPVVDLRVLRNRSLSFGTIYGSVLGIGLYATLFLLPVYLQNSQGYTAFETGMVLLPSALMSMVSFMVAGPLSQRFDPRRILAIGTVLMMLGSLGLARLTTLSGTADLFWPLMLRGMAMGMIFIPLTLTSLGGLKPEQMGVGSGMVNLSRQLGGSIGIAALSTLLSRRAELHQQSVASHVNAGNPGLAAWISETQGWFVRHGYSHAQAHDAALMQLGIKAAKQATMLSFNDCFLMIGIAFACSLPLIAFLKKPAGEVDMSAVH